MSKLFNFENCIKILFVILFFTISISSAVRESITFDEIVHVEEGRNAWIQHAFAIDTNNPPFIREIQVIPLLLNVQRYFPIVPNLQILPARSITILFGIFLLLLVMSVTRRYFGQGASILSGMLFIVEPNILGNSHYVTQDVGVTLLFFFSYILLLRKKTKTNLLLFIVSMGLGFASKMTFAPFFFLSSIVLGTFLYKKDLGKFLWKRKKIIGVIIVSALFIVWATYFFKTNVIVAKRSDTTRVSARLMQYAKSQNNTFLKNAIFFSENQQIPLGDYLATLKNSLLRSSYASDCFFLGYYSPCAWYFMPVNMLLKIPLPLFILIAVSLWTYYKRKKKNKELLYFVIPMVCILAITMFLRLAPLLRYVLPAFPFLIILSAAGYSFWVKSRIRIGILVLLLLWYIVGTLSSFPHFISYANELTRGQKYFLLSDSNMDWGQSLTDVASYHNKHPQTTIQLSYFGRDTGDAYGLHSDTAYGSYKSNEICMFHSIKGSDDFQKVTLISISNWNACGYNKLPEYSRAKIREIINQSIFVF